MSVGLNYPDSLQPIAGIRLAAVSAGLYDEFRTDLALIEINANANVSAVFTRNLFCAAPVLISKKHLSLTSPRYCLINAGNANAGNGKAGLDDTLKICDVLSEILNCQQEEILPFSTGVIGEKLAVDKIEKTLPELVNQLSTDAWLKVAQSIMTTDTVPKGISSRIKLDSGSEITITGIVKGSGMIKPNMATMLSFVATDANISSNLLEKLLKNIVDKSFNRITVDGDTSTNDSCLLIATGKANNDLIESDEDKDYLILEEALCGIFQKLAQAIIRDGEGAKKFIEIKVVNGKTSKECLAVAYKIAESPLVKTALTASDPNWGRILAAVGSSDSDNIIIDNISIYINDVHIVNAGQRDEAYIEEAGKRAMERDDINILVDLSCGNYKETIWTTDLSQDYIKINTEYRN